MSDADNSLPASGKALKQALRSLVETLDASSVRYAIIGGIATIQHGRVRTTADIDVLLTIPQLAMPALFTTLKGNGFTLDLKRNIAELRDNGLTTLRFEDVLIDMMRPILPVYSHVLDRAVPTQILGQSVRISTVEGLIVMKLIAFRPQDEADIQELISAYRDQLDVNYVRSEFATVANVDDPRWRKLDEWLLRES
ncbi:MAG TPA: nucleotidyltransferase [Tepidisphaeraceae bacterium]|nr:nucleotidyltransferase [Tepidisphaeraceae bacterium]